jgi:hypothetical protein
MKAVLNNIGEKLIFAYITILGVWITFALCFQLFFVYLDVTNQHERAQHIVNQIDWRIDGRFSSDTTNIWH